MKSGRFGSTIILLFLLGCGGGNVHSQPVAEWVISLNGSLVTQGTTVPVRTIEKLPKGRFRLKVIDLHGCPVKDADLEQLDTVRSLEELNLQETPVTDVGLQHLKGLHNLKDLNLYGTKVGDVGLQSLKDLPSLAKLELSYTTVTNNGLESLKGMSSLKSLHLYGTPTTEDAVESLREALPDCEVYH